MNDQQTSSRLKALSDAGVSIWLDDLSRELIETGKITDMVKHDSLVGMTSNPTIFAKALSEGERYDAQTRQLAGQGRSVDDAVFEITTTDVRNACDLLTEVWRETDGVDGRVSIEVPPGLAYDTATTVDMAKRLWRAVDRPNAYIKIPATEPGLEAITQTVAAGICVNVTLIFGLERYRGVMEAYLAGLERARDNGHNLADLHSVASFFVSRVDSDVDPQLDRIGTEEANALKGTAAVANARAAYGEFQRVFASDRYRALAADGARPQRPLWASTGMKNPDYPDTMYVTELVVPDTVSTMPGKTMRAFADHGEPPEDRVSGRVEEARRVLDRIEALGISYDDVVSRLETEGVDKFVKSWDQLTETVQQELDAAASGARGGSQ